MNEPTGTALPDGRDPESRSTNAADIDALQTRIRELEALCAEVYVAAVELGFPQPLLNRLWTVAAQGSTPHAFDIELPPRRPSSQRTSAPGDPTMQHPAPLPVPDIRLTDPPRATESRPRAPQAELEPLRERRTVMVVDDDPIMLQVLTRILERENYELLTAANAEQALQTAERHGGRIDLLVTDYAMPGMKGRELAQRMRARDRDIKVLYQTGFSDMLFENRLELEHEAAFLEKPFTARGLCEAARLCLFGSITP